MNMLALVAAPLRQHGLRTLFTLGSVFFAFLILGLLLPLNRVFNGGVEFSNASRLIVVNKASFMRPLPLGYQARLEQLDNVQGVGHFTFFGAFYQDPSNAVAAVVTDPTRFAGLVDEVEFRRPEQLQQWLREPTGVAIGRQLADKYQWGVGDFVPVYSAIFPRQDGSPVWTFRVSAIYDTHNASGNSNSMIINHAYFDEARAFGKGSVGWYAVQLKDSRQAAATAAQIDRLFANSPDETLSSTEKAFVQSFLRQVGDFGTMIAAALGAVFFTLLLVTANAMSQSVRERFAQLAALKALGFSDRRVCGIVLSESLLTTFAGGVLGLVAAAVAIPLVRNRTDQMLSTLALAPRDLAISLVLMAAMALVAAIVPAIQAGRLAIVDGLREAA